MPGISKRGSDDVHPEVRRHRALQPKHDADDADIGDGLVARALGGRSGTMRLT